MAISRVKTWTTNEDLTSSDLNSEFNQVMNNAANTGSAETISGRYTFSAGVILDELVATNAAGAGNIKISEFRWDPASGTAADGDGMYIDWVADDAGGTETIMARTGVELTDTDATGEDSEFEIHTMIAATLTKVASFGSAGTTFNTAVTVGVNDTGKDVKFFGATSGQYMLWDESADELVLAGDSKLSFHDAAGGENIIASADGHLEINAGTTLDFTATTIDLNGAVAMNGATTGGTNITISGELDAATLDISGNADIDGTTNLDAVDIDGAVQIDATVSVGVDDQGYDVKFFGDTASAYLLWDTSADKLLTAGGATIDIVKDKLLIGGTAVTTTAAELNILDTATVTAAELNLIDGGTARGTTAVASGDGILINDGGTMRMTNVDTVSTYFASHSVGGGNIVTTGALNSGSITSGFGTINNGSSAITTTGAVSAGALTATGNVSVDGGTFVFNDAGADKDFRIEGDSNQNLLFVDASTDRIGIGDDAPNGLLSLNQGADDGVIFTAKSSDIATGLTSGAHSTLETDDYFAISKVSATLGGARLIGVAEDAAQAQTVDIVAYGGTPETGKAISNNALITMRAYEHDGSNTLTEVLDNGNIFCVQAYLSGDATRTRFLVDKEGDIYAAQDAVTGLSVIDDYDDVALISALDYARDPEGVIKTDFEDFLKYNEEELVKTKILGAPLAEGGMTNVTQLQRLHNGAIRQLSRRLEETRIELLEARKEIKQLAA